MKALIILITSSLFLSGIPKNREKDSIKKILNYKIEKKDVTIKVDNPINISMPIIIVKKD
ncbi:hypothetical protein [Flavobacterium celericrescens]|uniref:Uncharacterized protein n=1 Tax=Flavobacterium celericrescens TaxID=2709780 RepID=A0ABX0I8J0_9FLAO|nr:hypothetical protein [Flavobacterium celericrescens]NHM03503.1 hypothetical protein [Flavobacterium celericrescens]